MNEIEAVVLTDSPQSVALYEALREAELSQREVAPVTDEAA